MNNETNNRKIRTANPVLPEPEGFITNETLAMRLSRTVRTVENWQRRGIIPYVKCGRCVLFKWTDVETHLQTHFRVCGQNRRPRAGYVVPPSGGSAPQQSKNPAIHQSSS